MKETIRLLSTPTDCDRARVQLLQALSAPSLVCAGGPLQTCDTDLSDMQRRVNACASPRLSDRLSRGTTSLAKEL